MKLKNHKRILGGTYKIVFLFIIIYSNIKTNMNLLLDVFASIRTFRSLIGSRSSKSYIQPKHMVYHVRKSIIVLENFGPEVAHNIKLKTFGISKISETESNAEIGLDVGLSEAKGTNTLQENESGEYEIHFLKYNMEFPFLVEWKSSTNEKKIN